MELLDGEEERGTTLQALVEGVPESRGKSALFPVRNIDF